MPQLAAVIAGGDFVDPIFGIARIVMKGRAQAQVVVRHVVIDFGIDPERLIGREAAG
jgi:hypothetical protein